MQWILINLYKIPQPIPSDSTIWCSEMEPSACITIYACLSQTIAQEYPVNFLPFFISYFLFYRMKCFWLYYLRKSSAFDSTKSISLVGYVSS